jgi:UDP-N-acetylmuramoyl-tripeptide--D-alanyl-D-alanine ligase
MHELGASSQVSHADIGTLASELGIDHLVCIASPEYGSHLGTDSSTVVHLFEKKEAALQLVKDMVQGDVVLVKASRAEKFEELAHGIEVQLVDHVRRILELNQDGGLI